MRAAGVANACGEPPEDSRKYLGGMLQHSGRIAYRGWEPDPGLIQVRRAARMASAMRAASTAGRTVWTRTMEAPLRMAATMAAMLAVSRASTGAGELPWSGASAWPRKDLRETPARIGRRNAS